MALATDSPQLTRRSDQLGPGAQCSPQPAAQCVQNGSANVDPRQRTGISAIRRIGLWVAVSAMLAVYLVAAGPTMLSAIGDLAAASPVWLLVGLGGTVVSMVAFAALRRHTLAVGGARVPLSNALAVSYGAGAVHATLPAGAVFSTTYAFRHLRDRGASVSAITWSMTVTGLLSTVTLSAVGLLGVVLRTGTAGSMIMPISEIGLAVAVIAGLVRVAQRPERFVRLAYQVLIRINRLRRRPAPTGADRLSDVLADLRVIRPRLRDWSVAAALAMANWALDLACLAACCAAVGVQVGFPALLLLYRRNGRGEPAAATGRVGRRGDRDDPRPDGRRRGRFTCLGRGGAVPTLSTGSVIGFGWLVIALQRIRSGPARRRSLTLEREGTP